MVSVFDFNIAIAVLDTLKVLSRSYALYKSRGLVLFYIYSFWTKNNSNVHFIFVFFNFFLSGARCPTIRDLRSKMPRLISLKGRTLSRRGIGAHYSGPVVPLCRGFEKPQRRLAPSVMAWGFLFFVLFI